MAHGAILSQTPPDLPLAGGTMEGPIEMAENKITGLGAPTDAGDAVNLGTMNEALSSYLTTSSIRVGSYNSTGASRTQTIDLGAQPQFVLVVGHSAGPTSSNVIYIAAATRDVTGENNGENILKIVSNGFTVTDDLNTDYGGSSPYKYLAIM